MTSKLKSLIKIPSAEENVFDQLIKSYRKNLVRKPADHVKCAFNLERTYVTNLIKKQEISQLILLLRERAYSQFLEDEAEFNKVVLRDLCEKLKTPKTIIDAVISDNLPLIGDDIENKIKRICGEYAGSIYPYIYKLSLSNTQSRRSRAGTTFEAIIYLLYEKFKYEYVSQGKIGKQRFNEKGLGKKVDSLLPNIEAFDQRRDKVIIGTMKTTLRERWQEVVEEVSRTGLPKIYLLTVDENISKSKAEQIGKHNIVLVVTKEVKNQEKLKKYRNIISYEDYFLEEIPEVLKFWENV